MTPSGGGRHACGTVAQLPHVLAFNVNLTPSRPLCTCAASPTTPVWPRVRCPTPPATSMVRSGRRQACLSCPRTGALLGARMTAHSAATVCAAGSDVALALADPSLASGVEVDVLKRVFGVSTGCCGVASTRHVHVHACCRRPDVWWSRHRLKHCPSLPDPLCQGGYLGDRWTYGSDWQFLCMTWWAGQRQGGQAGHGRDARVPRRLPPPTPRWKLLPSPRLALMPMLQG